VHAAEAAVSAADIGREVARQEAVAAAARAYWALSGAERLRAIAELSRAASEAQARITLALVDAGKLASVERTRIDAALAQADRALLDADAAVGAAADALAVAVGAPLGTDFRLTTPPVPPPELALDESAVLDAVRAGNLDLRLARQVVDDRERERADARHALLPELDATAGAALRGYDSSFGGSVAELGSGKLPQWSVGAELTLPLLNRNDRGAAAQAEAALVRARIDLAAREAEVETSARAQLRTLRGARQSLDLAELNVRLAEETLAAERARLGEGRSLQRDLITAQADLDRARADAAQARTDWLVALVELERLRGRL
jgi:outer membrane protein TolC